MARTAEVVTQVSLKSYLDSAKSHFTKAEQSKSIAKQVENIPDAYAMLMESVTLHEQEGFKFIRKIQAKVVNKLAEESPTILDVENLLKLTLSLFPEK